MKQTKTYRCTLNRTILSKSKSHGVFVSSKEVVMGLFGFTDNDLNGPSRSAELGVYSFYIRKEYYSSDSPKAYLLRAVKAGGELRITKFSEAFKALGITETDELLLERIEEDGNIVYLIDKISKPTLVIVEAYKNNNFNTLVYDRIHVIEKSFSKKSVKTVAKMVSNIPENGLEPRYVIDKAGKKILESLKKTSFKKLHPIEDVERLKAFDDAYNQLRNLIDSNEKLFLTERDVNGEEVYLISQEVKDLLDKIAQFDFDTRKDGGILNLKTPYWVWDNSYGTEIWQDFIDKRIEGYFYQETCGNVRATFIIRNIGTAEIPCADSFQKKTIYSISVFINDKEIALENNVYSIEKKGKQIIMMQRDKTVTSSNFCTSI